MNLEARFNTAWYGTSLWTRWLMPIAFIYWIIIRLRVLVYRLKLLPTTEVGIPVVVIGNINVGGTGKTPVVIATAKYLQNQGYQVGILSRGYQASITDFPNLVHSDFKASIYGDEPCLIAQNLNAPVVIDPNRSRGAQLLKTMGCQVIVCDDGLQHYALGRDVEIVVVDGQRGFGNQWLLPVGPLRESLSRLKQVDAILINGNGFEHPKAQCFDLVADALKSFGGQSQPLSWLNNKRVYAIAGIGNPQRFFGSLRDMGAQVMELHFPDHHPYQKSDIPQDGLPIIMTEKDAVKIRELEVTDCYYVPVVANLPQQFYKNLSQKLLLGSSSKAEIIS